MGGRRCVKQEVIKTKTPAGRPRSLSISIRLSFFPESSLPRQPSSATERKQERNSARGPSWALRPPQHAVPALEDPVYIHYSRATALMSLHCYLYCCSWQLANLCQAERRGAFTSPHRPQSESTLTSQWASHLSVSWTCRCHPLQAVLCCC